ncbi:hypothetical protein CEUSTIGMA_g3027.t1 [Chlamydomonas eustigma]|uniref:Uncharacterized protein n=1 Tax=Chlamydomonas eustigma TaxID=1157962 RepID=A0A250WXL9_9CHLO|nr:hypothetical protein CEUSTIGMA_g3027.t1 [Chlamydomonas eustigma]|eukprot:GAX75583.1 hypothetical protein CEUSTIGMA_g3027.t1 [Chlamydomonas eustigma]
MGSLLPGWSGVKQDVPKGFLDIEDDHERKGYFAKLEKTRSQRHSEAHSEDSADGHLLERLSDCRSPTLNRKSVDIGPKLPLSSQSTQSEDAAVVLEKGFSSRSFRHTDWEEELKSLGGQKVDLSLLSRYSRRASLGQTEGSEQVPTRHGPDAWWSHLDAGAMNMHPDAEEDKTENKSFTPQFQVRTMSPGLHD